MVTLRVVSDESEKVFSSSFFFFWKSSIHDPDFGLNKCEGKSSCLVAYCHNCKPILESQSAPPIVHIFSPHLFIAQVQVLRRPSSTNFLESIGDDKEQTGKILETKWAAV